MKEFEVKTNPQVELVFEAYPDHVRRQMLNVRALVIRTAKETEGITSLEETLRWGEPSYLTNIGSTLRMDWKPKSPDQYALYFKCTSRLVETFRLFFNWMINFQKMN
jgi:hypothetical protein